MSIIKRLLPTSYKNLKLDQIINFFMPLMYDVLGLRENGIDLKEKVKYQAKNGLTDVVTEADILVQKKMGELAYGLGFGFWGEEKIKQKIRKKAKYTMIVDPIEGTNNFKLCIDPDWGSVIAIIDNVTAAPVFGAIAQPTKSFIYLGVKEGGSWIIDYSDKQIKLSPMLLKTYKLNFTYNNSPHFESIFVNQVQRFMKMGKITGKSNLERESLDLIWKNEKISFKNLEYGALEAILHRGTIFFKTNVEMAAAFVIIGEMGGYISDGWGKPWSWDLRTLICAREKKDYDLLMSIYQKVVS